MINKTSAYKDERVPSILQKYSYERNIILKQRRCYTAFNTRLTGVTGANKENGEL